jgi:nucleoid-associated protein YgaU
MPRGDTQERKWSFIMTSDAKVGLLLGLVFITIIAFVINGLPRIRNNTNNNELTTNMKRPPNTSLGIAAKERKAREVFERARQVEEDSIAKVTSPSTTKTESKGNLRFEMPLPEVASTKTEKLAGSKIEDVTEPVTMTLDTNEKIRFKKPPTVKPAQPKIYVVSDGDNLAVIAQKFYGPEEGNRKVNVDRIFKANRGTLKSPDELFVGQKIAIPPLSGSIADEGESEGVFSGGLFEKVKSIGQRRSQSSRGSASKQYVVKEGDSLWKIAHKLLGDGTRYKEISRLNTNILNDEDNLVAGMRLTIPAL